MYGTLLDHVEVLAKWTQQERAVMRTLCSKGVSFKKVARELAISRRRVDQLHNHAVRKLMRPLSAVEADELTNRMLTISEVSNMLNVHRNTVRRWTDVGRLRCNYLGSRRDRRFWRRDVEEFLKIQTNKQATR